jgi:hypothetical protein
MIPGSFASEVHWVAEVGHGRDTQMPSGRRPLQFQGLHDFIVSSRHLTSKNILRIQSQEEPQNNKEWHYNKKS